MIAYYRVYQDHEHIRMITGLAVCQLPSEPEALSHFLIVCWKEVGRYSGAEAVSSWIHPRDTENRQLDLQTFKIRQNSVHLSSDY